jgi:hypothetical protein
MTKSKGKQIRKLLDRHRILIKDVATHAGCTNPITMTQFLSARFKSRRLDEYFDQGKWKELIVIPSYETLS